MRLPVRLPPAEAKPFDLVAVGESSLDFVALVDGVLTPDAKLALTRFETQPGGQAATAAVACARQGWRTRYVGCVGTDAWGQAIEAALAGEGLDVSALVRRAGTRSRVAVVVVERASGRRTVLEHRDPMQRLTPADLDAAAVTSGRVLLVDATNADASRSAARLARAAGIPTVVDIEAAVPGMDDLLGAIDILVTAESFPAAVTGTSSVGEGLRRLAARYGSTLVIATLGAAGSLARLGDREIHTPAPRVTVVDTTGAGDAFRGGFIAAWLRLGDAAPVDTLLEYANATAALSCQGLGAQSGLPTLADVDACVTRGRHDQSN
jgi:sugar/nucleoside kinase (ribokinase family)